jgi:hypothetical protein
MRVVDGIIEIIIVIIKIFKHKNMIFLMDNKIIHECNSCKKTYKNKSSLDKHKKKCVNITLETSDNKPTENNYDVNMTFLEGNKVAMEVKKESDDGEQVLKDILKPKISETYQEEINKLQSLIDTFKNMPIPENSENKDATISQLKNIVTILMTQSQNLIKEMQQMSRRNSYFKNNIMLAAFVLDKCRKEVPETDEEFENMFV